MEKTDFDIFNVRVYGIREALIRAGYPMATEVKDMKDDKRTIADMLRLGGALGGSPIGHGDDKYLRQVLVTFDVTAPRFWWAQADTYGVFMTKNSMSTMHKGRKMDFDKMANSHVDPFILARFKEIVARYDSNPSEENFLAIKANLPEGICLTAGLSTNYAQLKTIYYQRRTHRLPEWQEFCDWIETLPYAKDFGVTKKYAITCVAQEEK